MSDNVKPMPAPYGAVFGDRGKGYTGCLARGGRVDSAASGLAVASPDFGPAFAAAWRIADGGRGLPLRIETDSAPDPVVVIFAHIGTVAVACWPSAHDFPDREFPINKLADAYRHAKAAAKADGRQVWNLLDAARPVIWRSHYPDATPLSSNPWNPQGPAA